MNSMQLQEIALTENTSQAFEAIFERDKATEQFENEKQMQKNPLEEPNAPFPAQPSKEDKNSLILFVTIQGSEQLQGVCKVSSNKLIEEVKEDWKQYWQGKFKSAINVTWLIPNCAMPIAKVNQFL